MLGRRGPAQAAFTTPELKELGELAGADVLVDPAELELDAASEASLEHDTNAQRNLEVLREFAAREPAGQAAHRRASASSPRPSRSTATIGSRRSSSSATGSRRTTRRIVAVPTDEHETIPCGLVFRSVGYRGVALPGLPFDERRGHDPERRRPRARRRRRPVPGVYCAGWIKRGPTGVIGTNKKDATETVELLLEDARAGPLRGARHPSRAARGAARRRGVDAVALRRLGGDRPRREGRGRAARPAASQAAQLGGASCGRPPRLAGKMRAPRGDGTGRSGTTSRRGLVPETEESFEANPLARCRRARAASGVRERDHRRGARRESPSVRRPDGGRRTRAGRRCGAAAAR